MGYQTGVASSAADLVGQLRVFGESLGWLTNRASSGAWYFRDPTSVMFFAMEVATGIGSQHGRTSNIPVGRAIYVLNASAHSPGTLRDQPRYQYEGTPTENQVPRMELRQAPSGADPYWFFGTQQYLYVVWKQSDGTYVHLHVGSLDKKGMVYSGGAFVQCNGVYWNDSQAYRPLWSEDVYHLNGVRVAGFDTYSDRMIRALGLGDGRYSRHPDSMLVTCSGNAFTGDTVLVPNRVLVQGSSNRRWFLGESLDFAVVSLTYCDPEQILTFGAEEWQVFPCYLKGNIGTVNPIRSGSGDTGYAFRLRR